jgi:hypothetical protein
MQETFIEHPWFRRERVQDVAGPGPARANRFSRTTRPVFEISADRGSTDRTGIERAPLMCIST